MTETSWPWGGITVGDATLAPYSDDEWSDIWRKLFVEDRTAQGVLKRYANELAVSGAVSPVSVATGAALIDGKFYESDAVVGVAIPTPAVSTRIDRIVLRKDFAAQTVRITRIAGAEGGAAPAITQNDGVTWDIPLAQASITTGGAITLTDERRYIWDRLAEHMKILSAEVFSFRDNEPVTTGDDKRRIPIPLRFAGYRVAYLHAEVKTAPSGGIVSVQFHNLNLAADILSVNLTIDDGETGSDTAAAPYTIDTANDDLAAYDLVRIDIDAANGAVGLMLDFGIVPVGLSA
jgi:hypothetical protein